MSLAYGQGKNSFESNKLSFIQTNFLQSNQIILNLKKTICLDCRKFDSNKLLIKLNENVS